MLTSATWVKQFLKKRQVLWAHLFTINVETTELQSSIPDKIQDIIAEFLGVFAEPKYLPPRRTHDHQVPLNLKQHQSVLDNTGTIIFRRMR